MGDEIEQPPGDEPLAIAPLDAPPPPSLLERVAARWRLLLAIALPVLVALAVLAVLPGGDPGSVEVVAPSTTTTLADPFGLAPPLDDALPAPTTTTLVVPGAETTVAGATTTSTAPSTGSTSATTSTTKASATTTTKPPPGPTPITITTTVGPTDVLVAVHWGDEAYDAQTKKGASHLRIDFGDGVVLGRRSDLAYGLCEDRPLELTARDATARHAYRAGVPYTITATITSVDSFTTLANRRTGTATATITPSPTAAANGPGAPKVVPGGIGRPGGGSNVSLGVTWCDVDGFTTSVSVDWGDGSPVEELLQPGSCAETATSWPRSLEDRELTKEHDYGTPGTRTATLRVTTTGCGGQEPQSAAVATDITT